jgi:hypothetical protein
MRWQRYSIAEVVAIGLREKAFCEVGGNLASGARHAATPGSSPCSLHPRDIRRMNLAPPAATRLNPVIILWRPAARELRIGKGLYDALTQLNAPVPADNLGIWRQTLETPSPCFSAECRRTKLSRRASTRIDLAKSAVMGQTKRWHPYPSLKRGSRHSAFKRQHRDARARVRPGSRLRDGHRDLVGIAAGFSGIDRCHDVEICTGRHAAVCVAHRACW